MLLTLIIILVLIWAAVVWSIYSSFMVFYSNFSESENYHKAYYTSVSALERWELVVKQRAPWYVWNWWFILGHNKWVFSNWWSDKSLDGFSYLWSHPDISTVYRTINSRTSRIPTEWKWNIEAILAANDSKNYNMMDYENAEVFLLYYDSSSWNPYSSPTYAQTQPSKIEWVIRLPKKLKDDWWFLNLDTTHALVWRSNELPKDDAIVDWQIRWTYSNGGNFPFTIFSTQKTNGTSIEYHNDTIFRESDINWPLNFKFSVTNWNPLNSSSHWGSNPKTIISPKESDLASVSQWLKTIFTNGAIKEKELRFSLLNLLKDATNPNQKIYPFLEYYIDFWTAEISDKYFTIEGEWNYSDYQVNIIIQKPTVKETVLRNFTSIF